jgi:copper chaperone CopZ
MLYMVTVAMSAIGFGLLLDAIVTVTGSRVPDLGGHVHGGEAAAIRSDLWAILLLGVLAVSYIVTWRQKITARAEEAATVTPTDQRVELAVSGMTCEHCANIVRKTLADQPGISSTEVDVDKGRVVVTGQTLNPESLVEMISSLGYSARLANAP